MPTSDLTVPEGARLVHIGPHKTGSTAIQVALSEVAEQLGTHGVAYATGNGHRPRKAGWAIGIRGLPAGTERPGIKHWNQLVRTVAGFGDLRVCISNEDFGRADEQQARRVVEDLGGDRVHVVAVARRLDRYLPSQWQERVKAGDRRPYDAWLRVVLDVDNDEASWDRLNVWFSHDIDALVGRWVDIVGPDRFTLVLGDEADRDQLPRSFERLLGLPPQLLQPNLGRSNRGLSWAETELVRAINEEVAPYGWTRPQRRRFLVHGVLKDMQSRSTPTGPRYPPLPDWAHDLLRELSDRRVDQVRRFAGAGVRVVGDPELMRMPDDVEVAPAPLTLPALDYGIAAAAVAAVMVRALTDNRRAPT